MLREPQVHIPARQVRGAIAVENMMELISIDLSNSFGHRFFLVRGRVSAKIRIFI